MSRNRWSQIGYEKRWNKQPQSSIFTPKQGSFIGENEGTDGERRRTLPLLY
jgi:hypothetical protein